MMAIRKRVDSLAAQRPETRLSDFDRKVLELDTRLALFTVETLDPAALRTLHMDLLDLSVVLHDTFLL